MIKKNDIDAVKVRHGIPKDSTFLGYGIHRPDTKEYAVLAVENEEESHWGWSIVTQLALHFDDYKEVKRLVSEYYRAPLVIGLLFKHGDKVLFSAE